MSADQEARAQIEDDLNQQDGAGNCSSRRTLKTAARNAGYPGNRESVCITWPELVMP